LTISVASAAPMIVPAILAMPRANVS